jgi:hypothetical protein
LFCRVTFLVVRKIRHFLFTLVKPAFCESFHVYQVKLKTNLKHHAINSNIHQIMYNLNFKRKKLKLKEM